MADSITSLIVKMNLDALTSDGLLQFLKLYMDAEIHDIASSGSVTNDESQCTACIQHALQVSAWRERNRELWALITNYKTKLVLKPQQGEDQKRPQDAVLVCSSSCSDSDAKVQFDQHPSQDQSGDVVPELSVPVPPHLQFASGDFPGRVMCSEGELVVQLFAPVNSGIKILRVFIPPCAKRFRFTVFPFKATNGVPATAVPLAKCGTWGVEMVNTRLYRGLIEISLEDVKDACLTFESTDLPQGVSEIEFNIDFQQHAAKSDQTKAEVAEIQCFCHEDVPTCAIQENPKDATLETYAYPLPKAFSVVGLEDDLSFAAPRMRVLDGKDLIVHLFAPANARLSTHWIKIPSSSAKRFQFTIFPFDATNSGVLVNAVPLGKRGTWGVELVNTKRLYRGFIEVSLADVKDACLEFETMDFPQGVSEIECRIDYKASKIETETKQVDPTSDAVTMHSTNQEPAPRGLARLLEGLSTFTEKHRDAFLQSLAAAARKQVTTVNSKICYGVFEDELVVYVKAPGPYVKPFVMDPGPEGCSSTMTIVIPRHVKKFRLRASMQFAEEEGDEESKKASSSTVAKGSILWRTASRNVAVCDLSFSLEQLQARDKHFESELPHRTEVVNITANFWA